MLDLNIHVKTIDGISVFKISRMFGEVGMKDSKIGLYTMGFELKPYTINTGKYKAEFVFGENQRYVLYSGFEQYFDVENIQTDMGFNQGVVHGMLRFNNNDVVIQYEG